MSSRSDMLLLVVSTKSYMYLNIRAHLVTLTLFDLGINVGPLSQAGRAQLKPTGRRDVEAAIRQE